MRLNAGLVALIASMVLQGCVAAAIPIVAAGALGKRELDKRDDRPAQTMEAPSQPVQRLTSEEIAAIAADAAGPALVLTTTPSPAPPTTPADLSPANQITGYAAFIAGSLELAEAHREGAVVDSAVLAPGASINAPRFIPCDDRPPAVIIDLDGPAPSASASDPASLQPLADGLTQLRAANVAVLWLTGQAAFETEQTMQKLRNAGLDPAGSDQLLAVRSPADRKQIRRVEAASRYCILTVAGDQRGDFDELFDYLRQPTAPSGLDPLFGSSWFEVPPPLATPLAASTTIPTQ